jgi:methionyl aminopeptidase
MAKESKEISLNDWKKAGKIAAEVLQFGKELVKPGAKLLDVAEQIESRIKENDAMPAFPVNLSMNEAAAHYTPAKDDATVFKDQLVKLDVGVVYNGAIGDTACSIDLFGGKYETLIQASIDALNAAIKVIKPGAELREVGAAIENAINAKGFVPIKNLSGHQLDEFQLHAGLNIPNFDNNDTSKFEKGMFVAIEPFATDGAGMIAESSNPQIFLLLGPARVRTPFARKVLAEIEGFHSLPFAKRWLQTKGAEFGLREVKQTGMLKEYTPLLEVNKGMVSQAEHSIYVDDDGAVVLTK